MAFNQEELNIFNSIINGNAVNNFTNKLQESGDNIILGELNQKILNQNVIYENLLIKYINMINQMSVILQKQQAEMNILKKNYNEIKMHNL